MKGKDGMAFFERASGYFLDPSSPSFMRTGSSSFFFGRRRTKGDRNKRKKEKPMDNGRKILSKNINEIQQKFKISLLDKMGER